MEILESIGGVLLGIAFFVGSIIALILFFTVGVTILPFVSWLTGILFAVNIIALLIAISRKTRGVVGIIIFSIIVCLWFADLDYWLVGCVGILGLGSCDYWSIHGRYWCSAYWNGGSDI